MMLIYCIHLGVFRKPIKKVMIPNDGYTGDNISLNENKMLSAVGNYTMRNRKKIVINFRLLREIELSTCPWL